MSSALTLESPDSLVSSWSDLRHLRWDNLFMLPCWLEAWLQEFGSGLDLHLYAVREAGHVTGIAPLLLNGGRVCFIGSPDVCDYLGFVVAPGREREFFDALFDSLSSKGASRLDLNCLRADSAALTGLLAAATDRGYHISCDLESVSLEIDLPATWEEYLAVLGSKQGREVRRKLRRLDEQGDVHYRVAAEAAAVADTLDVFLRLLRASREEKAAFMTDRMESFFRTVAEKMGKAGLLRFGFLELNGVPVAAVMYFDWRNRAYLYNSGYDPYYRDLSVGLLSKVLCIKDSIEKGKETFDFMKGDEIYKHRLGGKEIPIFRCQIVWS